MRQLAADIILIENDKILLIKRGKEPFLGFFAVPGGRLEEDETIEQCAIREMEEETGLKVKLTQFIGIYSEPSRDPRKIVAVAYLAKRIGGELLAGDDAAEAKWFSLNELPKLAGDHKKIVIDALKIIK